MSQASEAKRDGGEMSPSCQWLSHMAGPAGRQQALAGYVVHFQAHAVRILEQHRVVAGRVAVILRRMDDLGPDRDQERMHLVDLKPAMREFLPRGEVVEPAWAVELMREYW